MRVEEAPAEDDFANGYLVRVFVPAVAEVPKFMERSVDFGTFKLTQMLDLQVTGGSSSVRGTGPAGHAGGRRCGESDAARSRRETLERSGNRMCREAFGDHSCGLQAKRDIRRTGRGMPRNWIRQYIPHSSPGMPIPSSASRSRVWTFPRRSTAPPPTVSMSACRACCTRAVAAAPIFGAKLGAVNTSAAEAMAGVKKVVKLENAVAVVADSYWRALKAVRSLTPTFTDTGKAGETSDTLAAATVQSLEGEAAKKIFASGDSVATLAGAAKVLDAEYRVPFLAHATMEPMNATARIADGRCDVWTGVQDPLAARKVAAKAAKLSAKHVTVHNQQLGGGFGRRLPGAHDFVDQAVRIAKEMSPAPVKLIWSREEDIQHDYYRPAVIARFKGAVNSSGAPTVWISKFNGAGGDAARLPYAIANQDIRSVEVETHVRLGSWRSVEHSQHGFFTECFIDELAHAAGKEPFEFRRGLLADAPRHRAVLEKAAWIAGWGAPPPAGRSRGIALVESFGSIVAEVAEVEVIEGRIKVHSVWAAVDCGDVINPDTAAAQIEGGIIFGLSAALFSEITLRDGRVEQTNFVDYPMPKLADSPRITVEFIRSGAALGGLGEPGVPPVAPAVANAVFAATGKRLRSLPLGF